MYGDFRIDVSFKSEQGKRHSFTEHIGLASSAQEAVDIIREEYKDLIDFRVEEVYREEDDRRWHIRTNWD